MRRVFDELNDQDHLEGLDIDLERIMDNIGLGAMDEAGNFQFIDLETTTIPDMYDILIKTIRMSEWVNTIVTRCQKRKKDSEIEMEKIFNRSISANKGAKATEVKAVAKSSEEYINVSLRHNSLDVYSDYLQRFVDSLEKYHYVVKLRITAAQENAKKPQH